MSDDENQTPMDTIDPQAGTTGRGQQPSNQENPGGAPTPGGSTDTTDQQTVRYKEVEIPGIGKVKIPVSLGSELTHVTRAEKFFPNFSSIDGILSVFEHERSGDELDAARKLGREALPCILSKVCSAIGTIMIEQKVLSTEITDPKNELDKFGNPAPASGWTTQRGHMARYLALEALCKLVKPTTEANKLYIWKRYETFCADIGVAAPPSMPTIDSPEWIERASLDHDFMTRVCAFLEHHEETDVQLCALLKQVKLVWRGYGLSATNVMYNFVTEANCKLFLRGPIVKESAQFKIMYENISMKMGEYFQYAKILKSRQIDPLNHAAFPNLYTAAVRWGQATGLLTHNMLRSTSIKTAISERVMDKEISEDLPEGARVTAQSEALDEAYEKLGINKEKAFPRSQEEIMRDILANLRRSQPEKGTVRAAGEDIAPATKRSRTN